jgi:chemotaxis protein CheC
MIALSEDQTDALVEIFNISIGRAAASMSGIVNEEISLTVPTIKFLSARDAATQLYGLEDKRVCGVMQHFNGPFSTEALLMFPEDQSLEIVRMMVGESYSMDELSELEQEAMSEVGNIILNACMGSIANIIDSEFDSTLPEVKLGLGNELLKVGESGGGETVMLIFIDFIIASKTIHGYMVFLMDVPSINGLIKSVDYFLNS